MDAVYCSPLGSLGMLATGDATLVQTENSFSSEPDNAAAYRYTKKSKTPKLAGLSTLLALCRQLRVLSAFARRLGLSLALPLAARSFVLLEGVGLSN
jgi:hypothetical protein